MWFIVFIVIFLLAVHLADRYNEDRELDEMDKETQDHVEEEAAAEDSENKEKDKDSV